MGRNALFDPPTGGEFAFRIWSNFVSTSLFIREKLLRLFSRKETSEILHACKIYVTVSLHMTIVIEIKKNANENNANTLRRFTRRVQESGILQKVKSKRYNQRTSSKLATKNAALKKMARRKEIEKLKKLGKIIERK